MAPGVGAPSMYITLMSYLNTRCNVNYFTTEANIVNNFYNFNKIVSLDKYNLMRVKSPALRKSLKYINWIFLNFVMLFLLLWQRPKGIIYAYEIFFVPAAKMYCLLMPNIKVITRFQGTILTPLLTGTAFDKLKLYIRKFDHCTALKLKADLIIMTDDGTKGDQVLDFFDNNSKSLFLKNGIGWPEKVKIPSDETTNLLDFNTAPALKSGTKYFYTACRLNSWKRVDRAIKLFKSINDVYKASHLFVLGSGPELEDLKKLVIKIGADSFITFMGEIPQHLISQFARQMDFFISTYELSNVGNPLWEAIEAGSVVITIANGETEKYIQNLQNGFIQPEGKYMDNSLNILRFLKGEITLPERPSLPKELTSWDVRINTELNLVLSL